MTLPDTLTQRRPSRPLSVTLLAIGVLSIAVINLIRFVGALMEWDVLAELLPWSPIYIVVSGLLWAVVWLPLGIGAWRGVRTTRRLILVAALVYSGYYWLDRLLVSPEKGGANWLFALGTNTFLLVLIVWMLSRFQTKAFFGELHE